MTFKKSSINNSYDSVKDDIYEDFFIPVLSQSIECKRFGGTFSSEDFLKIANGMSDFIMNDGVMQLILFPNFSNEDIDALNRGLKNEEDVLLDNWVDDYANISEKITKEHTKAFAWMIKNKFLEIKIIKITDFEGKLVKHEDLSHISLLKEKLGIFEGPETDDIISFRGNIDFDDQFDYSHITTFRYWLSGQREFCDEDYEKFEKFWSGEKFEYIKNYNFQAIDLPLALKENLIKISPESKTDLNLERPFSLRKFQQKAVDNWKENNFCGIYEMATGTGKTRTAIGSIRELEKYEKFISVIVVPTDPLGVQWKNELEKWGYSTVLSMGSSKWKQNIEDGLRLFQSNRIENLCIITSYVTYASSIFIKILENVNVKKFLIADEVHHAGSDVFQKGLDEMYDFRLGLTATLERYFDEEGTQLITNYFHDVVFTYDMDNAIKDGYLCKYNYHIRKVDLTDEEYVKYRKETLIMARNYSKMKNDPEAFEKYRRAAERRSNIVKSAKNKLEELKKIIDEGYALNYGLVYCNFDQINGVQSILDNVRPKPIFSRQITVKKTPSRSEKEEIFDGLVNGLYDVVLAINILDEGWDCPEIKNCILMASSGNEKQYVQRRGRILRPNNKTYSDGTKKEYAEIFDMCVLPEINDDDEEVQFLERRLVQKELNRMQIMANSASNNDSKNFLIGYRKKGNLEKLY